MCTLRKSIVNTLFALGFAVFFPLVALGPYYYSTRPREPHPEAGRIYPQRVKGMHGVADVYLTRLEKLPFDYDSWILTVYGALFCTACFLNRRWKVIPQTQ